MLQIALLCVVFLLTNGLSLLKGNWRQQLSKMNTTIEKRNEGRTRSRHVRQVTEHEWWVFWGIIIGACPCHKGGINLFEDAPAYRKFSPSINVSKGGMDVISKTRFYEIKEVMHHAFEGNNPSNPWNKIQPLIDGFNENRHQTVATSSTVTLDEIMSPFQPRTTQTSTLPHLSYIQRKPKPLGTEMKVSYFLALPNCWCLDLIKLIAVCTLCAHLQHRRLLTQRRGVWSSLKYRRGRYQCGSRNTWQPWETQRARQFGWWKESNFLGRRSWSVSKPSMRATCDRLFVRIPGLVVSKWSRLYNACTKNQGLQQLVTVDPTIWRLTKSLAETAMHRMLSVR